MLALLLATLTAAAPSPTPTPDTCNRAALVVRPAQPIIPDESPSPTLFDNDLRPSVVLVDVALDKAGNVRSAKITQSSGDERYDRAAIDAARNSTYSPRLEDCIAVPSTYVFRVSFLRKH